MGTRSGRPPRSCSTQSTTTPNSSALLQGSIRPPIDEVPTEAASARASTTRRMRVGSKGMRFPTRSPTSWVTSTSARSSASPSTRRCTSLARSAASWRASLPDASRPAAEPPTVASTMTGNTLFVPVESGTRGASRQTLQTARFVPSPPSTISTPQPAFRMASAARMVSPASSRASTSITSISASMRRFSTALCEIRVGSRTTITRSAPLATAPTTARATWSRLLSSVVWLARASMRRQSRPDIGLAMTPTGRGCSALRLMRRRVYHSPGSVSARAGPSASLSSPCHRCEDRERVSVCQR